eukprot:jgi/Tetstr1/420702/TSEL_011786.t1
MAWRISTSGALIVKLALRLHPDKNGGVESKEWLLIQGAYEVLGDAELRKEYDILGQDAASWLREQDRGRPAPGGVAPDMAEYMAKQQEARRRTSEAFAARKRREAEAAGRKATAEFMAEVDAHVQSTAESCARRAQQRAGAATQEQAQAAQEELEVILEALRAKQRDKLAKDKAEMARMQARMREDMEALRREWESAIDQQIDEERAAYEAERQERHAKEHGVETQQLSEADDMVAKAKAEMEAMMAQMQAS